MGEKEALEIQNLNDDDLLAIYQMLLDHIQYLKNNLIDTTIAETTEGGETANE